MKKNFKIFGIIALALLLIVATLGISAFAAEDPSIAIYKKNISYDDVIQLAYAVKVENADGLTAQVLFSEAEITAAKEQNISEITGVIAKTQTNGNKVTLDGTEYPVIFSNGIDAGELTKDIYAVPVLTDDAGVIKAVGASVTYSPYDHAIARFETGNVSEAMTTLYKAFLDYGAAIQDLNLDKSGETAPADGWADAYYKVEYYDATLVHSGTNTRDEELVSESEWKRAGETYEVNAKDAYLNGHTFANFWANGAATDVATKTYAYTPTEVGVNKLCAVYAHDFTERAGDVKTVATADSFGEYYYNCSYEGCKICDISEGASTYIAGMKAISQSTFTEDYSGQGIYYANNGVVNGVTYTGNKVDSKTGYFGKWNSVSVGSALTVSGTKHVFETDIKIPAEEAAKITMTSGGDKNIGWFGLSDNASSNSNGGIFAGFYVNVLVDENDAVSGFGLSTTTSKTDNALNSEYGAFNFDQSYNIRIEVTANKYDLSSVAEYYINGVHVGKEIFLKPQSAVTTNTRIYNVVCVGRAGGTSDILVGVNFTNIFYGTDTTSAKFVAGDGVYYTRPGEYRGEAKSWDNLGGYTVNKIGSKLNAASNTLTVTSDTWGYVLFKNANPISGTTHVLETDIMFDNIDDTFGADSRFAVIGLTSYTNGAFANAFARIYANATTDGDVTKVVLGADNKTSGSNVIATLSSGEWINLRIVAKEVTGTSVTVDIYVNGVIVLKGASSAFTALTNSHGEQLTRGVCNGMIVETRDNNDTYSGANIHFANTYIGTCATDVKRGDGVYYKGTVDTTNFTNKKLNSYDSGDVTNYVSSATIGEGNNELKDKALYSNHGGYGAFYIKGNEATSNIHVFETDIMFTKGTVSNNATETRVAWMGFTAANSGGNGYLSTCFTLNAVLGNDAPDGGKYIDSIRLGTGDNTLVNLSTDKWYNLRIVATLNSDGTYHVDIYLNGVMVQSDVSIDKGGSSADVTGKILNWGVCWRNLNSANNTSGLSMVLDNTFLGADMTPAE